MNNVLMNSINRIANSFRWFVFIGIFGGLGIYGKGVLVGSYGNDHADAYHFYPLALVLSVVYFVVISNKLDDRCAIYPRNDRTLSMYHLMGYYKVVMMVVAYFLLYRFIVSSFFGVGFLDFTPESTLFEPKHMGGTIHSTSAAFMLSSNEAHRNMFIGMYSFLAVYFVGGVCGYYWMKTKADAFERGAYSATIRRA
ncbi:hypothetical protein ALP05_01402 [Pseudomonas caricapapayae]|uniref:Uncharacterized protein n=1 Tax=Pseudomonas caricapapayae TaxID=46678 RepID=A0A3M6F3N5_9PSED|nr:hypothetical protein [Pseudomonas caricapapayae]RMV74566.1 hypothetical protein ALP05_01402 [Pseudomonas caricapapayae]